MKWCARGPRDIWKLNSILKVVAEAESGAEAVRLAREYVPDVVLMDLVMPEMDGVEATRKVKDVSPRTQIIVLTSYHQDEHIFPALQAGAISYLLKDVKAKELVEAIQRAAKGEATLHPRVAARVIKQFSSGESRQEQSFHRTDRAGIGSADADCQRVHQSENC